MTQHLSDELLQRHHDDDLSSSEAAEARAHLEHCAECRAQLAALERLSELVQLGFEDATRDVDFEGMLARIEASAEIPGSALSAAAAKSDERTAPVAPARPPAKIRRIRPLAPALGAIAIAAAALLMVFRESPQDDDGADSSGELAALPGPSEIVDVDFGSYVGKVWDITLDDGSSVPVVWINDDDEDE